METLKEFIDKHIQNYNGVRLYITTPDVSDEFTFEELENRYSYLLEQYVVEWSYLYPTFHIFLKRWLEE